MPPEEDEQAEAVAGTPCGACRTLRRRCEPRCAFAPYFTAEDFAAVHSVFGASNAAKMLERIELPEQRRVAAAALVEEARARSRDPSFGRVSYLRILQEVNDRAREQVDEARAEIAREFGALAASEPVDVAAAAASPEVRVVAWAQVDAALKHAREQDARLLGVRQANDVRWRDLHDEAAEAGTGKQHAGNGKGKGIDDGKHHRGGTSLSEQTMLMTPRPAKQRRSFRLLGFPDERERLQMAAAEAEREKALLMRQAAPPAKQHGHHLAAQHEETEPPPRHHGGDDAAGRTTGQGGTSVLLEAMMQLAGATGEKQNHQQQQHLVAQYAEKEHAIAKDKEHAIAKDMLQLQELLDMAELARNQKMVMKTEMGQWDAAAGGAREQDDVMTTMQQIPTNTWQHQEMMPPQQMDEEASTAELAQTTGNNMSQQFAWAQQYHHDPAAAHHASPWIHQMAEEHQQQVASEQDMLQLLQQHQVAAAAEEELLLSAAGGGGGARQFDNLAAQYEYDGTELTLGYGYGHPDMHQQHQQAAPAGTGQVALGIGNGHPDGETQALLQELAAILMPETIRKQGVTTTEMGGQWDAAAPGIAREHDVMTMTTQQVQDPKGAWLLEKLEQIEKASMPDLAKRLEIMSRQAEASHAQKQLGITLGNGHPDGSAQELFANAEMASRKQEMLMRKFTAAWRAREQELIAQQQHPVAQQYSGTELDISLGQGQGHPYWHQPTVQEMLQEQQLADAVGFGGHQANTTLAQAYANVEHDSGGAGASATMAFLSPGSAKDAPFLGDQQPQLNGHQMDSSLTPLPPSLMGQMHAQVSQQQRTDGGGQGLNSDLAAYLHYDESLSRHGLAGNGRPQQG